MPKANTPPASIMDHVSVGTNDFARAKKFYDAVLGTLKIDVVVEYPGAAGYGRGAPEFWLGKPHDGGTASAGNGAHFAFVAASREQVDAFYAKALELGGASDGPPGGRELYGPQYYGAFVRDLDGNKIEASVKAKP